MVIQGAIHEKSRARTTRRFSRPEPIYAVDIAVAYTYKLIPPKSFIITIIRDIALCARGDFNKSPYHKTIEGRAEIPPPKDYAPQLKFHGKQKGKVATYLFDKNYGFITINDVEDQIFLHWSSIPVENQGSINPGDIIEFDVEETAKGWNAINVKIIQSAQCLMGRIKSYEEGKFGFIEVDDGGPDASFTTQSLSGDLREVIEEGMTVCFYVNELTKRRQAIKIQIIPEYQSPKAPL